MNPLLILCQATCLKMNNPLWDAEDIFWKLISEKRCTCTWYASKYDNCIHMI